MTLRYCGTVMALTGLFFFGQLGFAQGDNDQVRTDSDVDGSESGAWVKDSAHFLLQAIICERDPIRRAILVSAYRTLFDKETGPLAVFTDPCRGLSVWGVSERVLGLLQSSIDVESDPDRKQELIDLRSTYEKQSQTIGEEPQAGTQSQQQSDDKSKPGENSASRELQAPGSSVAGSPMPQGTPSGNSGSSQSHRGANSVGVSGNPQLPVVSKSLQESAQKTGSVTNDVLRQQLAQFDEYLSNEAGLDEQNKEQVASQNEGSSNQENSGKGNGTSPTDSSATTDAEQSEGEPSDNKPAVPWAGILEKNAEKPNSGPFLPPPPNPLTTPSNANSLAEGTETLVEDDVARFLREAIEAETDPVKKAELQAQYDAYTKK